MSETSETKDAAPQSSGQWRYHNGVTESGEPTVSSPVRGTPHVRNDQGAYIWVQVYSNDNQIGLRDALLHRIAAALNQPVPSGVLTEEERLALKNASTSFAAEACELSMSGYSKDAALHREWSETIDNLLARSAQQGETVTVRSELLEGLLDPPGDEQGTNAQWDVWHLLVAEAEAALAATPKGE